MKKLRLVSGEPTPLRYSPPRLGWLEEIAGGELEGLRAVSLYDGQEVLVWTPVCISTHMANWLTDEQVRGILWRPDIELAPLGTRRPLRLTHRGFEVLTEFRAAAARAAERKHGRETP